MPWPWPGHGPGHGIYTIITSFLYSEFIFIEHAQKRHPDSLQRPEKCQRYSFFRLGKSRLQLFWQALSDGASDPSRDILRQNM